MKLTGSLDGYYRVEHDDTSGKTYAAYGVTEKEAEMLLKQLLRRKR